MSSLKLFKLAHYLNGYVIIAHTIAIFRRFLNKISIFCEGGGKRPSFTVSARVHDIYNIRKLCLTAGMVTVRFMIGSSFSHDIVAGLRQDLFLFFHSKLKDSIIENH